MKINKYQILSFTILIALITSCVKKVEPVDTFNVSVDYKASGTKYLTSDVTVNPKDSIYFDFTVSSPTDMAYIEIQKNGVKIDTFNLSNFANKKTFSGKKGYMVDSASGDYSYRVLARDDKAIFMGDGGKSIKVTVKPDFVFYSAKKLFVPDSILKVNECYFATTTGELLSYATGGTKSNLIDFGYFYDTTTVGAPKHTLYALTASTFAPYDISTWVKNATLLKKMPTSVNFVTGLTSAGAIRTLIGGNMTSGTAAKVTTISTTSGSNVIGFKTAAGKFGAVLIRFVTADNASSSTNIEIDVKVEK